MKLTDKAILRMVSESPGRNTSEPIGGPDKKKTQEAEFSRVGRRQQDVSPDYLMRHIPLAGW